MKDSLSFYYEEIGRYAILTKEKQLLHARNVRQWLDWLPADEVPLDIEKKGKRSFDQIAKTNLRLVISVAKKYQHASGVAKKHQHANTCLEDLIQEGNIGLLIAIKKFDPTRGYEFSTYAYWWIRQKILKYISSNGRMIRLPCNVSEALRKIESIQNAHYREHGTMPSFADLCLATGESKEKIESILAVKYMQPCSLEQSIGLNNYEDDLTLWGVLESNEESLWDQLESSMFIEQVQDNLHILNSTERRVISAILFNKQTKKQVMKEMNITASRINTIISRGTSKLKSALGEQKTNYYENTVDFEKCYKNIEHVIAIENAIT
jgi:RNA polymerase nonessential primary-like sigma factor